MDVQLKARRAKAQAIPVGMQIGKRGISEATILEIRKQLKKRGILKIRLLSSAFDEEGDRRALRDEMIFRVVDETPATLILAIGLVFTVMKTKDGLEQ